MFQGFLLPRGPRRTDEARAGREARPTQLVRQPAARLTVRLAEPADEEALRRLASLDSSRLPAGPLLVGEMGGGIQAAVQVHGGSAIANPFVRTAELVTLLETRAAQLREQGDVQPDLARVIPLPRRRTPTLAGRIA